MGDVTTLKKKICNGFGMFLSTHHNMRRDTGINTFSHTYERRAVIYIWINVKYSKFNEENNNFIYCYIYEMGKVYYEND